MNAFRRIILEELMRLRVTLAGFFADCILQRLALCEKETP